MIDALALGADPLSEDIVLDGEELDHPRGIVYHGKEGKLFWGANSTPQTSLANKRNHDGEGALGPLSWQQCISLLEGQSHDPEVDSADWNREYSSCTSYNNCQSVGNDD